MSQIKNKIEYILEEYHKAKDSLPYGRNNNMAKTFEELQAIFSKLQSVMSREHIKVKASYGKGKWSRVPWIAFMDDRETKSTQRGVYCVILFKQDMTGVYITLNQGVTDIINDNRRPKGYALLKEKANELRSFCQNLTSNNFLLDNTIKLSEGTGLGSDYEASTVAHKLYLKANVPDDQGILSDLEDLLQAYDEYLYKKEKDLILLKE